VELHTDSQYLRNAFVNKWLDKWQKNNWKTARKQPVLNQDLWQRLLELAEKHEIIWSWVKAHADNPHNNRCDELCQIARSRHGK
jgi:ribonuclease HI